MRIYVHVGRLLECTHACEAGEPVVGRMYIRAHACVCVCVYMACTCMHLYPCKWRQVSLWWAFYLFSISSGLPLLNWTLLGPTFLSCLFLLPYASLDVTEALSSRK